MARAGGRRLGNGLGRAEQDGLEVADDGFAGLIGRRGNTPRDEPNDGGDEEYQRSSHTLLLIGVPRHARAPARCGTSPDWTAWPDHSTAAPALDTSPETDRPTHRAPACPPGP